MKIKELFQEVLDRQKQLQDLQKQYDRCADPEKKKQIKQQMIEFSKGFSKFERK